VPLRRHRRQPVLCRKVGEPSSVEEKHRVPCDEQCLYALLGHRREGVVELTGPARLEELKLQAKRPGCTFDAAHDQWLGGTITGFERTATHRALGMTSLSSSSCLPKMSAPTP
jgi:hypothetical protein